jgi:hypothetical protein
MRKYFLFYIPYVLALSIVIILIIDRSSKADKILMLFKENKSLINKIKTYRNESFIQDKLIGRKLNVSSLFYFRDKNKNILYDKRYKILIFNDIHSCQMCVTYSINFWGKYISKNNLNKTVSLYTVIPTKNVEIEQSKLASSNLLNAKLLVDRNFEMLQISRKRINNSLIIYLNPKDVCLYAYFLESGNFDKLEKKLKIFNNYYLSKLDKN